MDLPTIKFIDKEYGKSKVVVDGRQLIRNNNRKRKSEVLQAYRFPLCDKCYRRDCGKQNFSRGYMLFWEGSKSIKKSETFPDQMN